MKKNKKNDDFEGTVPGGGGGGGTSIYLGYGDVPPFRVTFCSKLCSLRVCFSSYPKLCSLRVYIFLHFSAQGRYFVFFISSKVLNFSPTLNLISTIVSTTYPYLSSSILCTPLNVALNIEPPASDSSGETRRSSRKRTALVRDFRERNVRRCAILML